MKVRVPERPVPEQPDEKAFLPLSERKLIYIANPAAGGGRHLAAAENAVKRGGGELIKSERPGHLTELVADALIRDPFAHIVVYGGDGTVFEAVNGIMASGQNGTASFSVIPAGSGNDFSTHVNDPDVFERYELTRVDAVRTEAGGKTRYFANMMNIGFDCAVVRQTCRIREKTPLRGSLAYVAGVAKELAVKKTTDAEILLSGCVSPEDGEPLPDRTFRQKILLTAAGNGSHCGGGFNALPLADLTDGCLDVLVVNDVSRFKFVALVGDYRAGTYVRKNGELRDKFRGILEFVRCSRMEVSGPEYFCLDGEVFETGADRRVTAEVVPGALWYAAV